MAPKLIDTAEEVKGHCAGRQNIEGILFSCIILISKKAKWLFIKSFIAIEIMHDTNKPFLK